MLQFLARSPPRTRISHLDRIVLDDGLSVIEFKPPSDRYLVVNRLPPVLSDAEALKKGLPHKGANSSLAPPLHRHFWQDETFHVVSGMAKFTVGSRREEILLLSADPNPTIIIPRRQLHTFCNASEETDLVVEFVLDPASRQTDEAYFSEQDPAHQLKFCPLSDSFAQEMSGAIVMTAAKQASHVVSSRL